MRIGKWLAPAILGASVCCGGVVSAQTRVNPDISALGDFRAVAHNDNSRPLEKDRFVFEGMNLELDMSGNLNPYSRADVAIGWEGGENAHLEEAYFTILRGLPLDLQARGGKFLVPFGRINKVHEHAWSFIKRPLAHEEFFSDEGLNDIGAIVSALLPTGENYTELSVGALKGDALLPEDADLSGYKPELGAFGRLTTSWATSETSETALGVSTLNAPVSTAGKRVTVLGADVKYRNTPSRSSATVIGFEALLRANEGNTTDYGGFFYLDHRFRTRYSLGVISELVSLNEMSGRKDAWRVGAFGGFLPIEETLVVRFAAHMSFPADGNNFTEFTLQFVTGLGPHKTHDF